MITIEVDAIRLDDVGCIGVVARVSGFGDGYINRENRCVGHAIHAQHFSVGISHRENHPRACTWPKVVVNIEPNGSTCQFRFGDALNNDLFHLYGS